MAVKRNKDQTIFISLASFREPELRDTILSALENAEYPERIYFGVFSQADPEDHPDLSDIPNMNEVVVPASEARGPGYARWKVMQQYEGQDYFLQIDAHSMFPKNWDSKTISLYKKIQKEENQEKVIISFWGSPYWIDEQGKKHLGFDGGKQWDVSGPHYTRLVNYRYAWIGHREPMPDGVEYHESACVLGGFIFGLGNLVEEVPYDPDIIWTGEESMFSIRAYCQGWKIYSPRQVLLYHNYVRHGNPRAWEGDPTWSAREVAGLTKMYERLSLKIRDRWGIKDEKLYQEYMVKFEPTIMKYSREMLRKNKLLSGGKMLGLPQVGLNGEGPAEVKQTPEALRELRRKMKDKSINDWKAQQEERALEKRRKRQEAQEKRNKKFEESLKKDRESMKTNVLNTKSGMS